MLIVAGSASTKLAGRVAESLGVGLVVPELKRFPDGESYVRIPGDLKGERVVVVQSTPRPQNENLFELFLLLSTAKDLGAEHVAAVVPYLAYARQNKPFKAGEAASAHTVCNLIERAGADEVLIVDLHEADVLKYFSIPARDVSAAPIFGRYFKRFDLERPLVLGPDDKAIRQARLAARELGAEADYLEKERVTPDEVMTEIKPLEVEGRDVVVIDDIISTGGTMIEAAKILERLRARKLYAACTHAVLAPGALEKLIAAGFTEVVASDTIETQISSVSAAPVVAEALR